MAQTTDWRQVGLVLAAGVIGACQIGKVAIAMPLLREDLGLSLFMLAWIAGAYAALGVVGGLLTGFIVSHFELRKVIVAGLTMIAAGNMLGAVAPDAGWLIASRVLEGIGFLGMVVACPPLLRQSTEARHSQMILAFWSTYIPVGALIMLVFGPFIMGDGWRWLWVANGAAAAAIAMALALIRRPSAQIVQPRISDLTTVVLSPAPVILASSFAIYAIFYFALVTFLPVIAVDRMGLALATAGLISAAALAANAVSNVCAGLLLQRGARIAVVLSAVFVTVALCGVIVFSPQVPGLAIIVAVCLCLGIAGLLPSTIISSMPRFAAGPQRLAIGMGLVQQASSLGQVIGPVALAYWVDWLDWPGVTYMFLILAACGLILALLMRGQDGRSSGDRIDRASQR